MNTDSKKIETKQFNIPSFSISGRIRMVSKRLGLSGTNLLFNNEYFFGLKVGSKIIQIGNGKENGCIRTDNFKQPVIYVGTIICEFASKEKMFAFKYPDKIENEDIFFLYGTTESQIFTEHRDYVRFYAPEFILAEC